MARGSSQVESRIVAILDEHRPLAGRIGRGGAALALAAIVGPIVLLAAGLRAADPPPEPQETAAEPAAAAKETRHSAAEPKAGAKARSESRDQSEPEAEKPPVKGVSRSPAEWCWRRTGRRSPEPEVPIAVQTKRGIRVGVRRTKTDEQGEFSFEDVPAGSHVAGSRTE